ncbi:hypothetical protein ACFPOH_13895 [Ureibacillus suwonensis]|uniref:Uncharacterized protein n=1 Tax=Ureibacillus suwonensis TaxID=313007 RepID=A0ABW0RFV8_9BACL
MLHQASLIKFRSKKPFVERLRKYVAPLGVSKFQQVIMVDWGLYCDILFEQGINISNELPREVWVAILFVEVK